MDEQNVNDLQAELAALRQRVSSLEAEYRNLLRRANRTQRPRFSRKFLLSALPIVVLLVAGGVLYAVDALFIDSNGNVGIGTPSPGAKLDVAGTVRLGRGTSMESWFPYTDNKAYITGLETIIRKDGSTVLVKISDTGVGVGTTDPKAKLDVNGTLNVSDNANFRKKTTIDGDLTVAGTASFAGNVNALNFPDISGGGQMLNLWTSSHGIGVQSYTTYFRSADNFAWYQGGTHDQNALSPGKDGNVRMVIKDGNVGIGTTDPAGNKLKVEGQANITGDLYVNGWIRQPFSGTWYKLNRDSLAWAGWITDSDIRLKTNVQSIPSPLEKIARLRGVSYQWNRRGLEHLTREIETTISAGPGASAADNQKLWQAERDKRHKELSKLNVGVIAQEVEAVLPEAVTTDDKGYKSVRYHYLIPLLIEAIKEQAQIVARQQAEIERLKAAQQSFQQQLGDVAALRAQIARLETAVQGRAGLPAGLVTDPVTHRLASQSN